MSGRVFLTWAEVPDGVQVSCGLGLDRWEFVKESEGKVSFRHTEEGLMSNWRFYRLPLFEEFAPFWEVAA
jgi:hypothetical protein